MGKVVAGSPVVRRIQRSLAPGYRMVSNGPSSKFQVVAPDGALVRRADNRPIMLPTSPKNESVVISAVKYLRAAGALKEGL